MDKNNTQDMLFDVKTSNSLAEEGSEDINSKSSDPKLDSVSKISWKNLLEENEITTSALGSLDSETFDVAEKSGEPGVAASGIGLCEIMESVNDLEQTPVKMLKEWSREDFEQACKLIINGTLSIENAVSRFGIPKWLLIEKIEELSKKTLKKRKTNLDNKKPKEPVRRRTWTNEKMGQAIFGVKSEKMSIRAAAAKFGVPRSSLFDRVARRPRSRHNAAAKSPISDATNDLILPDEKTWVIKSLQDGLIPLEEASLRLGLTREETRSFCESLNSTGPSRMNDAIENEIDEASNRTDRADFDINSVDEDRQLLNNESVIENMLQTSPVSEQTIPSNEQIDIGSSQSMMENGIKEGHWSEASMVQVCDARQNIASPERISGVNALPYTMLSGLQGWADEYDDENEEARPVWTSSKKWTWEAMNSAIREVREHGLSIRKAAVAHGIPKSSLADRLSGKTSESPSGPRPHRLKKGAMKELKCLAKTTEQLQTLRQLNSGKIAVKKAAKELGIGYAKMKQYLTDESNRTGRKIPSNKDAGGKSADGKAADNKIADKNQAQVTKTESSSPDHRYERPVKQIVGKAKRKSTESIEEKEVNPAVKKERMRWTREDMEQARSAVKEGRMSIRRAASFYDIPKSTLGDVVSGKCAIGTSPGPKRLLSDEEESALAGWLSTMYKIGRKITINEVLNTVKAILDKDGHHLPRLKDNLPKTSWWYGFLSRHKEVALLRKEVLKAKPKEISKEAQNTHSSGEDFVEITEERETEVIDSEIRSHDEAEAESAASHPREITGIN